MVGNRNVCMLADRIRPTQFNQMIGNKGPLARLTNIIANGLFPPVIFITGPTGCGKTTLARIVAKAKLCLERRQGQYEPCGCCDNCKETLDDYLCGLEDYEEVDAAAAPVERIEEWRSMLLRPSYVLFIDELQDMARPMMKRLRKILEGCRATAILTTTHREEIEDALLNRLKSYEYTLARPGPEEIADSLEEKCRELTVRYDHRHQLLRVAEALDCEMRPCAEFPRRVLAETNDGKITNGYLDQLFGHASPSEVQPIRGRRHKI